MQTVTDGLARLFGARAPWARAAAQPRAGGRRSACRSPSICSRNPRCADCPAFPETMIPEIARLNPLLAARIDAVLAPDARRVGARAGRRKRAAADAGRARPSRRSSRRSSPAREVQHDRQDPVLRPVRGDVRRPRSSTPTPRSTTCSSATIYDAKTQDQPDRGEAAQAQSRRRGTSCRSTSRSRRSRATARASWSCSPMPTARSARGSRRS